MKKPRASPNTCGSMSTASAIGVCVYFMLGNASQLRMLFEHAQQIFAVTAFFERLRQSDHLFRRNESRTPGNLFHAGYLQSLPLLDDAHEHAGIEQGVVRAGIEPCRAAGQPLDVQLANFEVG